MKNGWKKIQFEYIYKEPSRNGLTRPRKVRGKGYKMVNMGELFRHDRINNPPMELVPMNKKEIENYSLKKGDLLFARQSLVASGAGKCSIIKSVPEITTFESHLIRVRLNTSIANPFFYYYYFNSPPGFGKIQSIVNQVAAAGIRGSELAKLIIDLPPKQVQDKVTCLLSDYDDLIENNSKRIRILEKIAKMIYEEWFEKFRFPGHQNIKMVDSELGFIPEGWNIIGIYNFSDIKFGYPFKSKLFTEDSKLKPVVRIRDIQNNKTNTYTNEDVTEEYAIHKKDILIGMDGIFHMCLWSNSKSYLNQRVARLRPKDGMSYFFLYYSIRPNILRLNNEIVGTTVQHLSQKDFKNMIIIKPSSKILNEFNKITYNILNEIILLRAKNINLQKTRDLLLPKLINGEIDVSDLNINIPEEDA